MACKCILVDWSTTQSFLLVPGVGLWEEMVIPHRIDPNHSRISQQSEGLLTMHSDFKISVNYAATLMRNTHRSG